MSVEFKLIFEGEPDLDIEKFNQSLPSNFTVEVRNKDIYVIITTANITEPNAQYLIDRELDRHFFLTNVKIKAGIVQKTIISNFCYKNSIHGTLADNIRPQQWNYELPIQLKLWSIASDTNDLRLKIILLFQIIELTVKKFEPYNDPTKPPDPLTECKFLRNFVSHSGDVNNPGLKLYCDRLGLPNLMLDITDPDYYKIIKSKISILEQEAKKIIKQAL